MKKIVLLAATGWLYVLYVAATAAASAPAALVALAVDIEPTAMPGQAVQLMGGTCHYVGQLVREPGGAGSTTFMVDAAGSDSGQWHIQVTKRACSDAAAGAVIRDVALRVNLPRPPALAGGGGVPPLPRGYKVGDRLELQGQ